MNDITQNNNLKEHIFKKIDAGEVCMKPKSYFMRKVVLLVFVTVITFIVSTLLISYILFSIKTGGEVFLLGFGTRGFYSFILLFPWFLLLVDAILLLFLDWLLKEYRWGYGSPIIYLFLGTLGIITVVASIINFTPFHRDLMYRAEGKKLPLAGGFYDGLRKSHGKMGLFRGEVSSTSRNTFRLKYDDYDTPGDDGSLDVIAPLNVDIDKILQIGDQVFVAGDLINGQIKAYGVKKLTNNE